MGGVFVRSKKLVSFFVCVMMLVMLMPMSVSADTGPKPSVTVTITGLKDDELYYATLLSERESTGPASAYDGEYTRYEEGEEDYAIWKKFVEYDDSDGFYFLQEFWKCSGNDAFRWGYYPPTPFKILLYFPEYDAFAVSDIYERYAFDSYYTASLEGLRIDSVTSADISSVEKSYDYSLELVSLFARILITIVIEMVIALLFGFRAKKQITLLVAANVVTQVILNVLLNIVNYNKGQYAFVFYYVLWEFVVFAIEAFVYTVVFGREKFGNIKKGKTVCYALVANAVSFVAGMWIAHLIPGIF